VGQDSLGTLCRSSKGMAQVSHFRLRAPERGLFRSGTCLASPLPRRASRNPCPSLVSASVSGMTTRCHLAFSAASAPGNQVCCACPWIYVSCNPTTATRRPALLASDLALDRRHLMGDKLAHSPKSPLCRGVDTSISLRFRLPVPSWRWCFSPSASLASRADGLDVSSRPVIRLGIG
jgi:hypothetical protein